MRTAIAIIGAGPAGCRTAELLARAGLDVAVFEEHSEVGRPVQCTGLVTNAISRILPVQEAVINRIHITRISSPDGNEVTVRFRKPNLVLDRARLDQMLACRAKERGAQLFCNHRFISFKNRGHDKVLMLRSQGKLISCTASTIIGADGPLGQVAQAASFARKRKFLMGIQKRIRLRNDNAIEFSPINKGFSWVVPESRSVARIGIATVPGQARRQFEKFYRARIKAGGEALETSAGLIPLHSPIEQTSAEGIYLVGDAAGMVKATTGGGIIQGLIGAQALADAIVKGSSYELLWRARLQGELLASLLMRKLLDRFTPSDYNKLVALCQKKSISTILGSVDRDETARLGLMLLAAEPRLGLMALLAAMK